MTLKRKIVGNVGSLRVVVPHQIAEMHDIKAGDTMEFLPKQKGEFLIKIYSKTCRVRKIGTNDVKMIQPKDGRCIIPRGFELVE